MVSPKSCAGRDYGLGTANRQIMVTAIQLLEKRKILMIAVMTTNVEASCMERISLKLK